MPQLQGRNCQYIQKIRKKIHLRNAPLIQNEPILSLHVPTHLWNSDTSERDICKGQVAEEEVPRGLEAGVQPDEQDGVQVSQDMTRNRANNTASCSGWMGTFRRRNAEVLLWFSRLVVLYSL